MEFAYTRELRVPVGDPKLAMVNIKKFLIIEIGEPAPDIAVKTLDGKNFKLSGLRGKVVLVDFWATWCTPCIAEMPGIKRAYDTYGRDGRFTVIGISLDDEESAVKRFLAKRDIPWSLAVLGPAEQNPVAKAYNVSQIPATFLIGPDGKVMAKNLRGRALARELQKLFPTLADAGK